jgi:ferredoxin
LKDEGGRADLPALLPWHQPGWQLYTCGSARYMDAVFAAAAALGWPEAALHREYFQLPEAPERVNHPFQLRLARSARVLQVPADRSAAEVLAEAGIAVPTKCSDGLCGVCAVAYDDAASDAVEHRDVVLGAAERAHRVVLCCSRAAEEGGTLVLEL